MLYFDKEILMRALTVLNVIVPWFIKTRSLPRSRPVWCRPGRQSSGEVYLSWFEHLWCSVTWGDRWRSWWCLRSGVGMVPVYDFFVWSPVFWWHHYWQRYCVSLEDVLQTVERGLLARVGHWQVVRYCYCRVGQTVLHALLQIQNALKEVLHKKRQTSKTLHS